MARLSVIVNTKNSAAYLEAALESVAAIADEIVLVDMASSDETLIIAEKFDQVKIYQYPDPEVGYADPAREFAFERATGEWLLILDSDECLPSTLSRSIREIVDGKKVSACPQLPQADIYYLPRNNEIFGHFFEQTGWYPDYQLRLWRAGKITWRSGVHSQPIVKGTTAYLPYQDRQLAVIHHNYQTVSQFLRRLDKYTTAAAQEKAKTCSAKGLSPAVIWQSFFDELWRRGFRDEGMLEGTHGVSLSLLQSAYELVSSVKTWEAKGFPPGVLTRQELKSLRRQFLYEARYWWADLLVRQSAGMTKLYWRWRRFFSRFI